MRVFVFQKCQSPYQVMNKKESSVVLTISHEGPVLHTSAFHIRLHGVGRGKVLKPQLKMPNRAGTLDIRAAREQRDLEYAHGGFIHDI